MQLRGAVLLESEDGGKVDGTVDVAVGGRVLVDHGDVGNEGPDSGGLR